MDNFLAHILVVDDDDGIRSLVKKFLNENNYLVTTANSSEDASDKINIIKDAHLYLENRKEIGKVISIYSLIEVANQINKSDLTTFELSVLYNEIPKNYKEDLIFPYLNNLF